MNSARRSERTVAVRSLRILLLLLAPLAACTRNDVVPTVELARHELSRTYGLDGTVADAERTVEAPDLTLAYACVEPVAGLDGATLRSVRELAAEACFGRADVPDFAAALEELAQAAYDAWTADVRPLLADFPDAVHTAAWEFSVDVSAPFNDDGLLSLERAESRYTGGAHGLHGFTSTNIDLRTGRRIALRELFPDAAALTELGAQITRQVRREHGAAEETPLTELGFFVDRLEASTDFGIRADGLLFQYDEYEVGPYALGELRILVPYAELADLLGEEAVVRRVAAVSPAEAR